MKAGGPWEGRDYAPVAGIQTRRSTWCAAPALFPRSARGGGCAAAGCQVVDATCGSYARRVTADGASAVELRLTSDPVEFLAAAEAFLAGDPVVNTVVTGMAHRMIAERADGISPPERYWWATVVEEGRVVGAAMRTALAWPHPPYLLPMTDAAAVGLARALHDRGEEVLGVNGALPAVWAFAEALVRFGGGRIDVAQHTRLHELTDLLPPAPVPGALYAATPDDADVATAWLAEFMGDADEQAGRPRGSSAHEAPDRDGVLRRIRDGRLWFWCDEQGQRVHLLAAGPPALAVARIGPVYTPPEQRGRGWASNAVAELSRRLLADGNRVCLFTDQANPTSNKIYSALGYRPVVDMVNLLIVPDAPSGADGRG